ncbi:hypothetical protein KIN20_004525 [Parelaphostrongylus tenuis]|uniref:Uncharacterized protein n=1 Tax=Parelaphostrongylus tenuis TaxID=148309 RepID=A0AAD5QF75_PARTN|nr:hypothetical protein KIN20_004525 [Parelaphostrongylus tenuis]
MVLREDSECCRKMAESRDSVVALTVDISHSKRQCDWDRYICCNNCNMVCNDRCHPRLSAIPHINIVRRHQLRKKAV